MQTVNIRYAALPHVSCREEDDGAVLYNPDIDKAIIINPTGLFIWNHIQQPQEMQKLVDMVSEAFEEIPQNLQTDIETFISQLGDDFIRTDDGKTD